MNMPESSLCLDLSEVACQDLSLITGIQNGGNDDWDGSGGSGGGGGGGGGGNDDSKGDSNSNGDYRGHSGNGCVDSCGSSGEGGGHGGWLVLGAEGRCCGNKRDEKTGEHGAG